MKKIILAVIFLISLVNSDSFAKDSCTIEQVGDVKVGFEGYKTDFKAGVSSQFKSVKYSVGSKKANNLKELLIGSSVVIDTKNIKSDSAAISENIIKFFFDILESDKIKAEIIDVNATNRRRGNLSVDITMNGVTKRVAMSYVFRENSIFGLGKIDIVDFNAGKALASLNKACFDVHLGKTWEDVGINFEIPVKKVCKK